MRVVSLPFIFSALLKSNPSRMLSKAESCRKLNIGLRHQKTTLIPVERPKWPQNFIWEPNSNISRMLFKAESCRKLNICLKHQMTTLILVVRPKGPQNLFLQPKSNQSRMLSKACNNLKCCVCVPLNNCLACNNLKRCELLSILSQYLPRTK